MYYSLHLAVFTMVSQFLNLFRKKNEDLNFEISESKVRDDIGQVKCPPSTDTTQFQAHMSVVTTVYDY